jgi:hypothetical protein
MMNKQLKHMFSLSGLMSRKRRLAASMTSIVLCGAAWSVSAELLHAAPKPEHTQANSRRSAVHDYGKSGDDPATEIDESAILASDNLAENGQYQNSTKFAMTANATPVSVYKYQKGSSGS